MATINLEKIGTKETLTTSDVLNLEVITGKFNLSYRAGLINLKDFFLASTDLKTMMGKIDEFNVWLDKRVHDELMNKEIMDNKFLELSEAKYYYKRLLTDEVMEDVCSEYADTKMLSSLVDDAKTQGQLVATNLANALALHASIVKTQAIQNDTDIQLAGNEIDFLGEAAQMVADAISALLERIEALEEAVAALEAGGGGHDMTYANLSEAGKSAIKQLCLNKTNHPNPWGKDCPVKCWICGDERANPGDLREHVCKSHKDNPEIAAIIGGDG